MASFFSLADLGLASSSSELLQTWLQSMQTAYPGYNPSAASLEYIQARIIAAIAADVAAQASSGATELFRTFGTQLVNVAYQNGVAAQAVITIVPQASPSTIGSLATLLSTGGPIITLPVVALAFGISPGTIVLSDPTLAHTQTWTTTGANAGDTSVPVTPQTPNFAYPIGSTFSSGTGTQQYVLEPLTQFVLDQLGFVSLTSLTVIAGTPVNLTVAAVQTGTIFNGAGSGGVIQAIQQLSWVTSITLVAAASGGQEPEDDTHYLDRLTTALRLQAPRPITASDFGTMALNFAPYPGTHQQDVGRATAVDGYDPANGLFNNTRTVAVAVTDANGFALNNDTLYGYPGGTSSNVLTTVPSPSAGWGIAGWLRSLREINFIVNVINPIYSRIWVTVTVKATPGYDATTVQLNVQTTLLAYLSPQAWGLPPSSSLGWQNTTTIFQSTLVAAIQATSGVDHVVGGTLAFGLAAAPSNTVDLVLPGPIALPTSDATSVPTSAITIV